MNFKQFGVSKNVMPSANAETKSNNGITISCDGKGKYHVEGKATEYTSITFNLEEFVIPVSVGAGGQGTFSMFNTESFTNNAVTFLFYNSNTRIDDWVLMTINRTNTFYNAMGNKTVTAIKFNITADTECDFDISPMLTNDGQLPAEFEPHMIWHDINHYIMGTDTDTLTTLPADIYANDTTATVGLKGNMEQSGTPTPSSPIQPQECGERTGNLFDKDDITNSAAINTNTGEVTPSQSYRNVTDYIDISGNDGYIYISNQDSSTYGAFYNESKVFISGITAYGSIVVPNNAKYLRATITSGVLNTAMINLGSSALPYEPWGIKIPILSNSTTTNVYLGEVQSTRRIKKLVLTGRENWDKGNYPPTGGYQFFMPKPSDISDNPDWLTTHFKKGSGLNGSAFGSYLSLYPEASILPENATANDFKAWLTAQYDAGMPVTIWYILATLKTAVVNEPLRKIGDYADEVSGITIPTIAGANTLSIGTTLQPSEVSVNYHGWHPVQSVHERDNGAWD